MRLNSMNITFKYTCGLVNVEQTFNVEFAPNEKVDMTSWIIDKAIQLEQAGMRPAVVKEKQGLGSPTARAHGATGRHPDDLEPQLDGNGKQVFCPECQRPLYRKQHIFKSGSRKGQPGVMICHDHQYQDCKFIQFED